MKWHIGCSGFNYKEWKEVFYPQGLPQRRWFGFYCSQFATLELNVTFYRFPQLSSLKKWYDESAGQFLFSVKAPRLITHYKQLKDCERLLNDFYSSIREGLKEKLGMALFQFPPQFSYTGSRLEMIMQYLQKDIKNVVEFRHNSWWNSDVYRQLHTKHIIFSGISHPALPDDIIINNPTLYYRFHGVPLLYYSAYNKSTLQNLADNILKSKTAKEVFIFFNNTAAVGAIENALWLKEYVLGKDE